MSTFVLPSFNLAVNIWRFGSGPPALPAVVTTGNLSPGKITGVPPVGQAVDVPEPGGMWLRLPIGSDIRDAKAPGGRDVVECPAGSGRMYHVGWVDDIGGGFANEHRFAILVGQTWPVPFPDATGPWVPGPPPPGPFSWTGQSQFTTGLVAAGTGSPPPNIVINLTDRSYCVVSVSNPTMGPPAFLFNLLPIIPTFTLGPIVAFGITTMFYVLKAPAFVGMHQFTCNMPLGQTAFINMIQKTAYNVTPLEEGEATNIGIAGAIPTVVMSGAGLTASPNLCTGGMVNITMAGGIASNPPFIDGVSGCFNVIFGNIVMLLMPEIAPSIFGVQTYTVNSPGLTGPWAGWVLGVR